jgi:hypothetical protein
MAEETARAGPAQIVTYACKGCRHLLTQAWEAFLDNDETDRGTYADCAFESPPKRLPTSPYWYTHHPTPDWCPYLPKS